MNLTAGLDIAAPERCDVEDILAVAGQTGLFSAVELATVQELMDASLDQGATRSGYHFILARHAHDLAGFACYGPRPLTEGTFDLYWIVVAPRYGRSGAGGYLLERVVEQVRALGGRLLITETSGLPQYLPAREFYLRHGFCQAAAIADFYAPGDDLALYVRRLSG